MTLKSNHENNYIEVVKNLHTELSEYIIKSGIQKEKYDYFIKNLEKKSTIHIMNTYVFLIDLKDFSSDSLL